jgi:uncharacterized membrane protein YoaK (UPF0700 family)
VLSLIAGSTDVIGFLGLGGLFIAHITGNLVILAAHLVTGLPVSMSHVLSVPTFIVGLGLTRVLVAGLEVVGRRSLPFLLLLQFLLLGGWLGLCISLGPPARPTASSAVIASMLGVSALAVQNGMVQSSLKGAPSTAVLTSNVTRFTMDVGDILLGRDPADVAAARRRAKQTWPVIVGFTAGAALGAWGFAAAGSWSLALPVGLALVALVLGTV